MINCPFSAKPIAVLLLFQKYVLPVPFPVSTMESDLAPEHREISDSALTIGLLFMIIFLFALSKQPKVVVTSTERPNVPACSKLNLIESLPTILVEGAFQRTEDIELFPVTETLA